MTTAEQTADAEPDAPLGRFRESGPREATDADVPAIREIYAAHVEHGTGTFEELAPDLVEMQARLASIRKHGLPFLVAGADGSVQGFAYAGLFRPRRAYRYTVEDSVYVHPDAIGQGLGRQLLGNLIEQCEALGYRQMVAVIGDSANARSVRLHESLGFEAAGVLANTGYKFDRWLDVVFMQRRLGPGAASHP